MDLIKNLDNCDDANTEAMWFKKPNDVIRNTGRVTARAGLPAMFFGKHSQKCDEKIILVHPVHAYI